MQIAILTIPFFPAVGGVQTVTDLLATGFLAEGHIPIVITPTLSKGFVNDRLKYRVVRTSNLVLIYKLLQKSDAVIAQGECLRLMLPLLLIKRPTIMVMHMLPRLRSSLVIRMLENFVLSRAKIYAVSKFVAQHSKRHISGILPNPFSDDDFVCSEPVKGRVKQIAFVGGLSSGKGVWTLIDALDLVAKEQIVPITTFIGGGYEERSIRTAISKRGWGERVAVTGQVSRSRVASELIEHQILIVPSQCKEAFGIVILEGLASGCKVIGANDGGLPEALSGNGTLFSAGNAQELATAILHELSNPAELSSAEIVRVQEHLKSHAIHAVARRYLEEIFNLVHTGMGT